MGKHIIIKQVDNGIAVDVDYAAAAVFEKNASGFLPYSYIDRTIIRVVEELVGRKVGEVFADKDGREKKFSAFLYIALVDVEKHPIALIEPEHTDPI